MPMGQQFIAVLVANLKYLTMVVALEKNPQSVVNWNKFGSVAVPCQNKIFSLEFMLHIYKSIHRLCIEDCWHIRSGASPVHLEILEKIQ